MQLKNYNVYFFFILLIGITILTFFVVKPFIVPFILAVILANLFGLAYRRLLGWTGNRKGISAASVCLLVIAIIALPLFLVSSLVINEIQSVLDRLSIDAVSGGGITAGFISSFVNLPIVKILDLERYITHEQIVDIAKSASQSILLILQSTYSGAVHLIFVSFIMFFSLFYLLIDGERLGKAIMTFSPLKDEYELLLSRKFNSIARATIKGTSLIAIIQGSLAGILFWATGVSSPVLFGILTVISSVVPSVGSGLIWFPVGAGMILFGYPLQGLIIWLVGGLVISMIDNFIRPKLVGRDTEMHPLMILFATLGGIALFGISGFIVGPIAMALFVALWEIYSVEFKEQLGEYNND